MTTTLHEHQQQVVLTMIGSADSDRVGYFTASMGLMIPMHAMHYRTKGAATATMTVTVTGATTATTYEQLLYGAATACMQWSEGAGELCRWMIADNTMTMTIYAVRFSLSSLPLPRLV